MDPVTIEQTRFAVHGICLNVAQAGPEHGQTVLLLHGFPEYWYGWRHQITSLAEAGYRVLAPDQRGYNLSDKPVGVNAYRLEILAGDIIGLIEAVGNRPVNLVGHDWGGAVAWWLAARRPELLRRTVVINCPHPAVFRREIRCHPLQWLRSGYMLFFQIPRLPEILLRLRNGAVPASVLRRSSLPDAFPESELRHYRLAWSRPGAWTAMLNWYRALLRMPPPFADAETITAPTLMIWGTKDRFLGRRMAAPSIERCKNGRLVMIEDATHWVHRERADTVNAAIGEFLTGDA